MGTRVFSRTPIVPTLQRGNAFRDALRHTSVLWCQVDLGSTQVTFSPLGDLL
ncbi:DUF1534 domain-containing protein [Pseudomonas syringae]|nr:DUF1534 domain-containing protein [Pseudomonas syringae]NAP17858.1 DUF1534 domain-containing protein [Pseudomonas syringae]NAP26229.1 DUF1534 domain-containing protein [Pseudomonas syringae]NAP51395.1 DUF1534 domain-containing protein [Pseudomonas syringae]NAP83430.1 DUF1534 domain-containing protein [Pseudomonas syringae]